MNHRIRFAMQAKSFGVQPEMPATEYEQEGEPEIGFHQADETFMGGKNKKRHADKK